MGYKELTVAGLNVAFRNVPGSGITRISIDRNDVFGFDPDLAAFVQFSDGKQLEITPGLPDFQAFALRRALVKHSEDRRHAFAQGFARRVVP